VQELALGPAEESEHVGELNEPPAPPSLHVMEPVGEDGDEEVSATVAVNVTGLDAAAEAGFGDIVKVVA
jgi:hypothetical protein